jgi:NAD(P)H-hydrate epimerase
MSLTTSTSRVALAQLFRATGQAHHQAFAATNGDDAEWPEWYARHLALPLSRVLGRALPHDALATALRDVDVDMRAKAPAADWPQYYADWFLARRATSHGHG